MAARVKVTILCVGQGMSNLIELYDAAGAMTCLYLIDCGGDGSYRTHVKDSAFQILEAMDTRAQARGMAAGQRYCDCVILSHQDNDHHSIIKALLNNNGVHNIQFGEFMSFDETYCTTHQSYDDCAALINSNLAAGGQQFYFADGSAYDATGNLTGAFALDTNVHLIRLFTNALSGGTRDTNTVSAVLELRITFGATVYKFLFPGDPTNVTMNQISNLTLPAGYSIDYMSAPHHGSFTTCGLVPLQGFLNATNPVEMVISAGDKNIHGHPHKSFTVESEKILGPVLGIHTYQYNTTDSTPNRAFRYKKTNKRLYSTIHQIVFTTVSAQVHYLYDATATGMNDSMEDLQSHPGFVMAPREEQPWRAVAKPGARPLKGV